MSQCALYVGDDGDLAFLQIDDAVDYGRVGGDLENDQPATGLIDLTFVQRVAGRRRIEQIFFVVRAIDEASQPLIVRVLHGCGVHEVVVARMGLEDISGVRRADTRTSAGAQIHRGAGQRGLSEWAVQ